MPAWNRIDIPKDKLEELYINKGLSIAKIANIFRCATGPIHRSLREYKIPIRSLSEACTKIKVSKQQLKRWYFKEKLSMFEIADKLGCTHSSIVLKFQKLGLRSRGRLGLTRPIRLTKKGFEHLYYDKRLSLGKIARIAHCSKSGLERRFKHYNLKSRGMKNRACKYKKGDFSGDLIEKAYLIGFRLGDLNVTKVVNVIQVRCSSTIQAQIKLIKNLFKNYSTPRITKYTDIRFNIPKWDIVFLVNKSFNFLLSKKDLVPSWITNNKRCFFSFLAGYSDAEGSFLIHKARTSRKKGFAIYEVGSQQKNIIHQIWKNLLRHKIKVPRPTISKKAGYVSPNGSKNNKDFWKIGTARKKSLWSLIEKLEPYIKHENKIKSLRIARQNLEFRLP